MITEGLTRSVLEPRIALVGELGKRNALRALLETSLTDEPRGIIHEHLARTDTLIEALNRRSGLTGPVH